MTRISHRMKVPRENLQMHFGWFFLECEYKLSNLICQMNRQLVFSSVPLVSPAVYALGRSQWCDQLELGLNTTLQADVTRWFLWLPSIHFICTPGDLSMLVKLALAFFEWNYADLTPRIVRRESVVLSAPNGDCPHHWLEVSCDGTSISTMNGYMDVAALDDADWWIKWAFERWLGVKCWTDSFPSKTKISRLLAA